MHKFIYEYISKQISQDINSCYYGFDSFVHGLANTYEEAINKYNDRLFDNGDTSFEYQCVIIKHNLEPINYSEFYSFKDMTPDDIIDIIENYSEKHVFMLNNKYEIIHDFLYFRFDAFDIFENVSQTMYDKAKKYTKGKTVIDLYSGNEYIIDEGFNNYIYSFKRLCEEEFIGSTILLKDPTNEETKYVNDISRYRIVD